MPCAHASRGRLAGFAISVRGRGGYANCRRPGVEVSRLGCAPCAGLAARKRYPRPGKGAPPSSAHVEIGMMVKSIDKTCRRSRDCATTGRHKRGRRRRFEKGHCRSSGRSQWHRERRRRGGPSAQPGVWPYGSISRRRHGGIPPHGGLRDGSCSRSCLHAERLEMTLQSIRISFALSTGDVD